MRRNLARVLAPLAAAGLVACGGSTGSLPAGGDGGGGGGNDGGTRPGSSCPAQLPLPEDTCSGDISCEYGSDPDVACDSIATCTSSHWATPVGSVTCSTGLPSGCPADYGTLTQQTTCGAAGLTCTYDVARCTCDTHCGIAISTEPRWCCPDAPPNQPGCPSPRPREGSACSTDGTVCDYGGCSGNVTLACTSGTWQPTKQIACPG